MKNTEEIKFIYSNLLNGQTVEKVAEVFQKSAKEVLDIFDFVTRKLLSYAHEMGQKVDSLGVSMAIPHVPCENLAEARANRIALFERLEMLNLSTPPKYTILIKKEMAA
jgi:hypothetical protein